MASGYRQLPRRANSRTRPRADFRPLVPSPTSNAATKQKGANAQLIQAQRMKALGQLAAGVAHDFNNVLQTIQGGAQLIERRGEDPDGRFISRGGRSLFEAGFSGP